MRILVVEDDIKISSYLGKGLSQVGHSVDTASSAEEAESLLHVVDYELAIIDLMLPRKSGEVLIRAMRAADNTIPIVILSAKQSVDERVAGLRAGADDYVTKPFSFSELLERVHALRRRVEYGQQETKLEVHDLLLDLAERKAYRDGTPLDLRPREYSLLELLVRNHGNVVPKAVILERIWNMDFDPQTNVVDVLVHRVRQKVDAPFGQPLIHTVRGVGYTLKEDGE